VRRVQIFDVRVAILAELERLTATFPPGHIDRPAGLQLEFVAGVRLQGSEEKLEFVQASGKDLLEMRDLPEPPTFIILFGQGSHRQQHIHHADVTFGLQDPAGCRFNLLGELGSVHGVRRVNEPIVQGIILLDSVARDNASYQAIYRQRLLFLPDLLE
jgi:hypothetical protein